jgi:hypothetical protein
MKKDACQIDSDNFEKSTGCPFMYLASRQESRGTPLLILMLGTMKGE